MDLFSPPALFLTGAAFLTAIISALLGGAGGILLLTLLLRYLPLTHAVPVHGIVQLLSNLSRVTLFLRDIRRLEVARFFFGSLLGAFFAWPLLARLQGDPAFEGTIKAFIGLYLLFSLASHPAGGTVAPLPRWAFPTLGLAAGFLGMFIGSSGPLIASVVVRSDLLKNEIIATQAFCQFIVHFWKIPLFYQLNFSFAPYFYLMMVMGGAVVLGTLVGKKLGWLLSEERFKWLFRLFIFAAGLELGYKGIGEVGKTW